MGDRPIAELLFLYDTDTGILSAFVDQSRTLLALNGCPLCALTHSLTGERPDWAACKAALGVPVTYVHRDALTPPLRLAIAGSLPCVLARTGAEMTLLLTRESLLRCHGTVANLRARLQHQAAQHGLRFPPAT